MADTAKKFSNFPQHKRIVPGSSGRTNPEKTNETTLNEMPGPTIQVLAAGSAGKVHFLHNVRKADFKEAPDGLAICSRLSFLPIIQHSSSDPVNEKRARMLRARWCRY